MLRFVFVFLAFAELALASSLFIYESEDGLLTVKHGRLNFHASLVDSSRIVDFVFSHQGQMLSCTQRKATDEVHPKFKGRTGTIDELIRFFLDRGVHVDNLATLTNLRNIKLSCSESKGLGRFRRSVSRKRPQQSTMFLYPGTKWCGRGNIARNRDDLGENFETDSCCRDHDNCRGAIRARTRRFNFYNDSPFTINSCRCDEEFKTCLQSTRTPTANNVGEIFFNRVGMRCYRFRYRRRCVKRSWGICRKYGIRMEAYPVQLPRWVSTMSDVEDY